MRPSVRLLAINGLGLYVMLMYGVTYYGITTAAPRMAAEFGLPTSTVFGAITVGLLVTAAGAPRLGRLTDRIGAATILLAGALLRAGLLAAMARAPEPVTFMVALLLVQVLGQATEYDVTFAAAVELAEDKARTGMSQITLWGGLASTAFWPLTAHLLTHVGWRAMFLGFAATLLIVCVPIAAAVRAIPHMRRPRSRPREGRAASLSPALSAASPARPPFWVVAAAFALGSIAYGMPALMLPVLEGLGLGTSAVLIGMIFGPAQTAGRFLDMVVGDRVHPTTVATVATGMVAIAFGALLFGGVWAAIAFAVLFGAGAGVGYVVRGSVVLSLYGAEDYATWLGRLGTVRLVVTAMSPLGLALVLEGLGSRSVLYVCVAATLASLVCFMTIAVGRRRAGS